MANEGVRVLDLAYAPGEGTAWGRPRWYVYMWGLVERLLVTNSWQISSRLRVAALRAFGAQIGEQVIFRPRTRVLLPWKLRIGDGCWIGEGVWIHNQDLLAIGRNVVISQETFLTCGSHAHRKDMALITKPIIIEDGVWITSRCMVLGGATVGRSALVSPMSIVRGHIPPNSIVRDGEVIGKRFPEDVNA